MVGPHGEGAVRRPRAATPTIHQENVMRPNFQPTASSYAICISHSIESDGTSGLFEVVAEKFKACVAHQKAQRALEQMSDQLRDIGVMRHEIPRAARGLACAVS